MSRSATSPMRTAKMGKSPEIEVGHRKDCRPSPVAIAVSGPVAPATHLAVQRCYRSQMDDFFREAMATDRSQGAVEQVWFDGGDVPAWVG